MLKQCKVVVATLLLTLIGVNHTAADEAEARKAIERAGGQVHVALTLPKSTTTVVLYGAKLDGLDLRTLASLNNVVYLDLNLSDITDAQLRGVCELKDLEHLCLSTLTVTDAGLKHLRGLKKLQSLHLGNAKITDEGLKTLASVENLKELKLWSTDITDAGLEHLSKLKNLEHLELNQTRITDKGLAHLKGLSNLDHLELSGTDVTDVGVRDVIRGKKLSNLNLAGTKVTDAVLPAIGKQTSLVHLHLDRTRVTDAGITELENLQTLRDLTLNHTGITDKATKSLAKLQQVAYLWLDSTRITDEGVKNLKRLKSLPYLDVGGSKITHTALEESGRFLTCARLVCWQDQRHRGRDQRTSKVTAEAANQLARIKLPRRWRRPRLRPDSGPEPTGFCSDREHNGFELSDSLNPRGSGLGAVVSTPRPYASHFGTRYGDRDGKHNRRAWRKGGDYPGPTCVIMLVDRLFAGFAVRGPRCRTPVLLVLALELALHFPTALRAQDRRDRFGDPLPIGALVRLGTLRFHRCDSAAYSPDGKTIATADSDELNLWDTATSRRIHRLPLEDLRWSAGVVFGRDGKKLAVIGSGGSVIQIWDLGTFQKVHKLDQAPGGGYGGDWSSAAAFSADDRTLVGATPRNLFVWDVATGKKLKEFPLRFEDKPVDVRMVTFSDDGKIAATQGDKVLHLWDAQTGQSLHRIELLGFGDAMKFSPDSKLLVVPGRHHWMNIFSVETGKKVYSLPVSPVRSVAFSRDGMTLAAVSNETISSSSTKGDQVIQLWNVAKLREPPIKLAAPGIHSVMFSPDGKTLAWNSMGKQLCFMDVATAGSSADAEPSRSHQVSCLSSRREAHHFGERGRHYSYLGRCHG